MDADRTNARTLSGFGLALAVAAGVIAGRWGGDLLFGVAGDGHAGGGAAIASGAAGVGGGGVEGGGGGWDTAWSADMAAATLEAGGEEVLVLLDARSERLNCYRVANQRLVEHMGGEDLAELFRLGTAVGAGR